MENVQPGFLHQHLPPQFKAIVDSPITKVALRALGYASLAAIATLAGVWTYSLGSPFALAVPLFSTAALAIPHLAHWGVSAIVARYKHDPNWRSDTVKTMAKHMLTTALIAAAVYMGFGVLAATGGAKLFVLGLQAKSLTMILDGARNFTLAMGFVIPLSQRLHQATFHDTLNFLTNRLCFSMRSNTAPLPAQAEEIDFQNIANWDHPEFPTTYFPAQAPYLTDEFIKQLMERRSDVLTFSYVWNHLTPPQRQSILVPQIENEILEKKNLSAIPKYWPYLTTAQKQELVIPQVQIEVVKSRITEIEDNLTAWKTKDQSTLKNAEELMVEVTAGINKIDALLSFFRSIDDVHKQDLKTLLAPLIQLKGKAAIVQKNNWTFRSELSKVIEKLTPKSNEADPTTPAIDTLWETGFRPAYEIKSLAVALDLPTDCTDEEQFTEKLAAKGLKTRKDLKEKHIIGPEGTDNAREKVLERLIAHIRGENVQAPAKIAAPSRFHLRFTGDARRVALIANTVFQYTLALSMIALQLYLAPETVIAGMVIGFLFPRIFWHFPSLTLHWQTAPSYLPSFTELCQQICCFILNAQKVTWNFRLGIHTGIETGENLRFLTSRVYNRAVNAWRAHRLAEASA